MFKVKKSICHNVVKVELNDIPEAHPTRLFHEYWKKIKGQKDLPLRCELLPFDIPALLPHIVLLEAKINNNRPDYFKRLEGDSVNELFGNASNSKYVSEIMSADIFEQRHREFIFCGENKKPLFEIGNIPYVIKDFMKVARGVFPFSQNGQKADYFVIVVAKI